MILAEVTNIWQWLGDSSARTVTGAIPDNLWTTLWHALAAGAFAVVLAVPLAVVLAHHGRAEVLSSWLVNLGRVIPTITVLALAVVVSLRNGFGFTPWPILFALTLLAIPPIYAATYTAIRETPADAVDAAEAMGMAHRQVMTRVELPLALPLIVPAVRTTVTQLVATEALGALFGGGGLGIYVRFGFAGNDLYQIQAGALLVAGTALATDLVLGVVGRLIVPRRTSRQRTRSTRTSALPSPIPGGTP